MPGDRAKLAQDWGGTYWDHKLVDHRVTRAVYDEFHRTVIDRLLDTTAVVVACSPERPTTIYGWACGEPGRLHYAHVSSECRGRGLGRTMVSIVCDAAHRDRVDCSHPWPRASERYRYVPLGWFR